MSGNLIEGQPDLISIIVTPESMNLPSGDNLLFSFTNDLNITSGDGNDTFVLASTNNLVISSSGGNNLIKGMNLSNADINLGQGDNTISIQKLTNSSISFGKGNNKIIYNSQSSRQNDLDVSPGENMFTIGVILDNSSLKFSKGIQNVSISYLTNGSEISINDALEGSTINIKYIDQSQVSIFGDNPNINIGDVLNSMLKIAGNYAKINVNSLLEGATLNISSHIAFANINSMEALSMVFASGLQNSILLGNKSDSAYVYTKSNYSGISYRN